MISLVRVFRKLRKAAGSDPAEVTVSVSGPVKRNDGQRSTPRWPLTVMYFAPISQEWARQSRVAAVCASIVPVSFSTSSQSVSHVGLQYIPTCLPSYVLSDLHSFFGGRFSLVTYSLYGHYPIRESNPCGVITTSHYYKLNISITCSQLNV